MSSSSSFPRSSRLPGDVTITVSAETNPAAPPPSDTTTTTFVPFPSSSSPQQPGSFFSGGASPPLIAGFISIGAFGVAIIAICAWCKFIRRRSAESDLVDRVLPARFRRRRIGDQFEDEGEGHGHGHGHRRGRRRWRHRQGYQRERSDELSKAKPEMFDAWIEKGQRTVDN